MVRVITVMDAISTDELTSRATTGTWAVEKPRLTSIVIRH